MHVVVVPQLYFFLKRDLYVRYLYLAPVIKRLVEPVNVERLVCVVLQNPSGTDIAERVLLFHDNRKEIADYALVQLAPQASYEQVRVELSKT